MAEIVMPRLSDTMEEGTILRWLKRDGEQVRRGEELVEIETDKATMTYESDQDGVLADRRRRGRHAGGRRADRARRRGRGGGRRPRRRRRRGGRRRSRRRGRRGAASAPARRPATPAPHRRGAPASGAGRRGERVKASPLARRIARESGVDLRTLDGQRPGRADREGRRAGAPAARRQRRASRGTAAASRQPARAPPPQPAPLAERWRRPRARRPIVELSRTQQTIARRMAESKATIPDFTLQIDVDMEECVTLRAELKRLAQRGRSRTRRAAAPTYNDMVVKACALALREHPRANGSYRDGRLQLHSRVNVGVAVAAEDALVVPTVFDADEKSLGEIARETRALAERVRDGDDHAAGARRRHVHGLQPRHVRRAAASPRSSTRRRRRSCRSARSSRAPSCATARCVARHTMTLTLACDHRILYGADAAQFLARIRELLEAPAALTL